MSQFDSSVPLEQSVTTLPQSDTTYKTNSTPRSTNSWFTPRVGLSPGRSRVLGIASFLLPLILWSAISYLPFLWHPNIKITDAGDV
ncbi:MAG: hypothetical protein AAF404_14775, partial [Pseudomonadota bacterium]